VKGLHEHVVHACSLTLVQCCGHLVLSWQLLGLNCMSVQHSRGYLCQLSHASVT
jgi:hypothetical protein